MKYLCDECPYVATQLPKLKAHKQNSLAGQKEHIPVPTSHDQEPRENIDLQDCEGVNNMAVHGRNFSVNLPYASK